jgi:L-lactate dehydrogenase
MGSGTTLDTARFRALLGLHLGVDPQHVHAYVVGEHGDSEVLTWSIATVGGLPVEEFCARRNTACLADDRIHIDEAVRRAAYRIIEGKGATYYGIGSALARIVEVILNNERSILTVCSPMDEAAGVQNVTISLPHLVGGEGILDTFPLSLDEKEQALLQRSAGLVREAIRSLGR